MAKIVIDPGHGGSSNLPCSDANHAVGPVHGLKEKNLTLDLALRVKTELLKSGHSVLLTRESDVNVAGVERAQKAKSFGADIFVSIHLNASDAHNAQGTETWVHSQASNTGASAALCRAVQAGAVKATGLADRNHSHPPHFIKKASFCVVNPANHLDRTAAVLVEVSFLDRNAEEERLRRDSYKDEIAFGISDGIEDYLGIHSAMEIAQMEGLGEVEDAIALETAATNIRFQANVLQQEGVFRPDGAGVARRMMAESLASKPKLVPVGEPVPFALSSANVADRWWPVKTSSPEKLTVSYESTDGIFHGRPGRRFLAPRKGGHRYHVAIDLFAFHRDVVVACEAGKVVNFYAFYPSSQGEMTYALFVEHDGFVANYGELKASAASEFNWKIGDTVTAGQPLARVSTTNMLHFETYAPGTRENIRWYPENPRPAKLLNPTDLLLGLAKL